MDTKQPGLSISLRRLVVLSIATRLLVDTSIQIFNPFLAIIATGLGTNVVVMGRLLSLRSIVGLSAPALGSLADRVGYRVFMRTTLLFGAGGVLLVGMSSGVWMATAGMIITGIGFAAFTPTLQAYLSDHLPYERRARGLAAVEYSWALAGIVGLSAAGYIIAATNWRAPFFILAGGMVVAWVALGRLPKDSKMESGSNGGSWRLQPASQLRDFFDLGDNARSAWSSVAALTLIFLASNQIIIMHGAWLEREYGLGAAQLGTVALILGLADLAGSVLISIVGDRIGKRRSLLGAIALSCGAYVLLPAANVSVLAVVAGLALARFAFETTVVSMLPLLSEQVPSQRAKVLTLGMAMSLIGVAIAGITGPWLYTEYGAAGLGAVSAGAALGAFVIAKMRVVEIAAG